MPPSNTTSSKPSHTNTTVPLAGTADPPSGTNQTAIIIGVSVGVGCLVLLIAGYKLWKCFTQRSKAPLPPKGPLAHDRQRQMSMAHPRSQLDYPPSMEVPSRGPPPFANAAQLEDHIRQTSDESSNPPSSPSVVSSQVHLVQTPTSSEENGEIHRPGRISFSGSSTARQYHHGPRHRTLSTSGSVRSNRSRLSLGGGTTRGRGPPHARHSRVDIVLPQPLAPGLYYENSTLRHSQLPPHFGGPSHERGPDPREDHATHRTSMNGPPSLSTEIYTHHTGHYPPPVPPLPASYHPITIHTVSPPVSPADPGVLSPFLVGSSPPIPTPSPERGPPPLPPPKDSPPHSSQHFRRHSESTHQRS